MAAKQKTTRSTRTKNIEELRRRSMSATLQWSAIAVGLLLLIVAVFVFGWGANGDGVLHSG